MSRNLLVLTPAAALAVGFAAGCSKIAATTAALGRLRRLNDRECGELVQEVLLVFFRKGEDFRGAHELAGLLRFQRATHPVSAVRLVRGKFIGNTSATVVA